ncbi:hypothetical protein MKS88_003799 [Plasmodium brasilianum]|uniref:Uncharacterized protein n=1 Tax=Plasmodium brasilianum TaxID=5824 RepID=A0ACB9Y7C7_PLABR|nr:hypothetical protein MKS88_003799 [Plasmodium brasilianum]
MLTSTPHISINIRYTANGNNHGSNSGNTDKENILARADCCYSICTFTITYGPFLFFSIQIFIFRFEEFKNEVVQSLGVAQVNQERQEVNHEQGTRKNEQLTANS